MRRFLFLAVCCGVFLFCILSCSQKPASRSDGENIFVSPSELLEAVTPNTRLLIDIPAHERIALIFGYGYNDAEFVSSALEYIDSSFISASGEPVILPFVFPDDFKAGSAARISLLYDKLIAYDLAGIVLLGSPENTHSALARLQDAYGGIPVVSLFSQDDQMGTEALSCLVFDFEAGEQPPDESALDTEPSLEEVTETAFARYIDDSPSLLSRVVYSVSLLDSPLAKNAELRVHASQMLGSAWNVLPYIDAETGMHPVNHFVLAKASRE
jgi:hypothetical protein